MKRILAILVAVLMFVSPMALAEDLESKSNEELVAMIEQLQQELAQLRGEEGEEEAEATEAESEAYSELARGAKGDEVKQLQQRLKDLGYLSGTVDGDFGGGTERAVSAFQSQNGLEATGKADAATQELLHSDKAAKAIVYETLDYKGASRDPSDFIGRYVKFSGKVLQVIEYGSTVAFRIASKGNYDNVVYVTMQVPENYSRILEDDRVEVSGTYGDLYSYKTVRGDTLTIPMVNAELITLC